MGIDFNNKKDYREMVKWFSPGVLIKTAKKSIISKLFGAHADRRLIQAALYSPFHPYDFTHTLKENKEGEIWIDYVADVGDGFDSTYAIAYLLAQTKLTIEDKSLPRGSMLIMGGDEVYPTPSRDNYKYRMDNPYSYAFPKSKNEDAGLSIKLCK